MRPTSGALIVALAASLFAGCSSSSPSTVSLPAAGLARAGIPVPGITHIYVADQSSGTVLGYAYAAANASNAPPNCNVGTQPTNIGTDDKLDLMEISGITITVYGPGWCNSGSPGSVSTTYGKPQDVAADYAPKELALAMFDGSGHGSLVTCVALTTCHNYTNAAMQQEARGVVMTNNGNCFVSAQTYTTPVLVYFAACKGAGTVATGFQNASAGGLDIDVHGNLLAVDPNANEVWVYHGCPACVSVTGSPLALSAGSAVYAHLNRTGVALAAADTASSSIDVYKYTSTVSSASMSYLHSFNNGLVPGVWGVAWLPRSAE